MKANKEQRRTPLNLRHAIKQSIWKNNQENQELNTPAKNDAKKSPGKDLKMISKSKKQNQTLSLSISIKHYMNKDRLLANKYSQLFDDKSRTYISCLTGSKTNLILPKIHSTIKTRAKNEKVTEKREELPVLRNSTNMPNKGLKLTLNIFAQTLQVAPSGGIKNTILKPKTPVPDHIRKIYEQVTKYNSLPMDTRASLEMHYNSSNLLIIGGLGANYSTDLTVYRTTKKDINSIKDNLFSRTKYAIMSFEQHILIHGGEAEFSYNSRQILNSFVYINAKTLEYHEIRIRNLDMPYKKGHICFVIGAEMFLDGGLYLDDSIDGSFYAVNLITKKVRLVKFGLETESLCHHKCVVINQNPYWTTLSDILLETALGINARGTASSHQSPVTILASEINLSASKEIVYVFGGLNAHRKSTNIMRVYQQQSGHLVIGYPEVVGEPPNSRFDHNMVFIKSLNALAIVGGKHLSDNGTDIVLDDLWLFQLNKNMWMNVQVELHQRYGFAITVEENDILIFGGFGPGSLIDGIIRKIEFNKGLQKEYLDYVFGCR